MDARTQTVDSGEISVEETCLDIDPAIIRELQTFLAQDNADTFEQICKLLEESESSGPKPSESQVQNSTFAPVEVPKTELPVIEKIVYNLDHAVSMFDAASLTETPTNTKRGIVPAVSKSTKHNSFVYADDFSPVLPGTTYEEGPAGKKFIGDREIVLKAALYNVGFKRRTRALDSRKIPMSDLYEIREDWVFSKSGMQVPKQALAKQVGVKSYKVDGERIMSLEGFLKRKYVFTDTGLPLTRKEKEKLTYDETERALFFGTQRVEHNAVRGKSRAVPKRQKTASSEAEKSVISPPATLYTANQAVTMFGNKSPSSHANLPEESLARADSSQSIKWLASRFST